LYILMVKYWYPKCYFCD